ncbi:MAG: hypothetical protein ABIP08_01370, partial [Lautropia sp.]
MAPHVSFAKPGPRSYRFDWAAAFALATILSGCAAMTPGEGGTPAAESTGKVVDGGSQAEPETPGESDAPQAGGSRSRLPGPTA